MSERPEQLRRVQEEALELFKKRQPYQTISLNNILQYGIQLLNILNSLHQKGLIHRDIKPENILFGLGLSNNQLFLIDYGLCKTYTNTITGEHNPFSTTNDIICQDEMI